ncbi:amidase [Candidatus Pelagibacter sp. HIMB1485]|jgi:Asp-tRNA(Asn)/Glu-tRNA(Gln) amidotransferase A subunit family amidase|uniref:amidase n=1 Tax=Candidatus Pelagibacter sp. HIMB1485 TaxID=3415415 RepID=UPI003F84F37D|tara:strand:+ start:193 stop:1521 length:1329 start_codon:yes stop_codon:yes gene_type:complete
MTDVFSLKVEELVEKIKDAQISSVELCQIYIDRINKFEKDIKAWAHFDKKLLLEKAAEADEHRRLGKPLGPLHGIPVAVKDIVGTLDMPTECGTVIRKGKSYSQNAEIIELLISAGAIVMGKTATAELAYLGPAKTTNPHDYSRTPGGSSSGSAASVASFMAPLSVGSQTGGSIIRPASYCGVVGYKPTYGLISRNGVLKTSEKLDHVGVFGRSVEDVALLAKTLIKKDKFDTASVHYSAENMLNETKKGPLFEPKFIFYKTDYWKLVEKKSRESFEYFIKSFKKNIEVFDTPSYFKDIHKYHQIIYDTDLANNFSLYFKKYKKKLSKIMQDAIIRGNKHSAKDYAEAVDFMKRSYESYEEVFEDYHGVLSPSSPGVAPKSLKTTGTAEFNKVWSYLGTPCISLPLLQGENNLPLGVQLIGAKYDDQRFLGVANWLEKECNN